MVPHEEGVNGREDGLLTTSRISGLEAIAGRRLALRVLRRLRQEILAAVKRLGRVETTADIFSKLSHLAQVAAVHVGRVDERSDLESF